MNRLRLAVTLIVIAVLLAGTVYLAAAWFPLTGAPLFNQEQPANSEIAAPRREPIKVGGNVQESKLIYRVEPTYPEMAKAARLSGKTVLVVTVNEEGRVWEVKAMSGHPLLIEPTISAVKQWRYSPTLLNGEPVPIMATVTVIFDMRDNRDSRMYQGRLFYAAGEGISPPELALDKERLQSLAKAGRPAGAAEIKSMLSYMLYINEVSEIVGVQRIYGPEIPEVERELARTRVVAPGRRGVDPVPVWWLIEIDPR